MGHLSLRVWRVPTLPEPTVPSAFQLVGPLGPVRPSAAVSGRVDKGQAPSTWSGPCAMPAAASGRVDKGQAPSTWSGPWGRSGPARSHVRPGCQRRRPGWVRWGRPGGRIGPEGGSDLRAGTCWQGVDSVSGRHRRRRAGGHPGCAPLVHPTALSPCYRGALTPCRSGAGRLVARCRTATGQGPADAQGVLGWREPSVRATTTLEPGPHVASIRTVACPRHFRRAPVAATARGSEGPKGCGMRVGAGRRLVPSRKMVPASPSKNGLLCKCQHLHCAGFIACAMTLRSANCAHDP